MPSLATKGSVTLELHEWQRELILQMLDGHFGSLLIMSMRYPGTNIKEAWDEAVQLKELVEGPLPPYRTRGGR